MAIRSRSTSFVPPPKVRIKKARLMNSRRPRRTAPGEPSLRRPESTTTSRRPGAAQGALLFLFLAVTVGTVAAFQYLDRAQYRHVVAQQAVPPAVGEPFTVFAGSGAQRGPAIAFDEGIRRHLIVWADTTAGDVYGRVIDDRGSPIGPHFPISVVPGTQISPTVAAGGPGQGFLVVWQDARNGDWDIYGQRVSAAGQLLNTGGVSDADPAVNVPLVNGPGDQYMPDVAYSLESDV